jgi:hypothetical protein
MRQIAELQLAQSFYGSRRMPVILGINRKHARRLKRLTLFSAVGLRDASGMAAK